MAMGERLTMTQRFEGLIFARWPKFMKRILGISKQPPTPAAVERIGTTAVEPPESLTQQAARLPEPESLAEPPVRRFVRPARVPRVESAPAPVSLADMQINNALSAQMRDQDVPLVVRGRAH